MKRGSPAWGWLGAFSGSVFAYYEIALISIIIVPIQTEFKLSLGSAALIPAILLLFIAVGGVCFGIIGDKIGRRNVLYLTIATYAIASFARAFTQDYSWLAVWTAIAGLGAGGELGVGQALISELAPIARRGFWSGALYSSSALGIILSALVGILLVPTVGWRVVFALTGLLGSVPLLVRVWTPESTLWHIRRRDAMAPIVWTRSFLVPFALCTIIGALQFFGYYLVNSTLPLYLAGKGLTVVHASYYVFATGAGVLLGSLAGGYLCDRAGRRLVGTVGSLLFAFFGTVLFSLGAYVAASPSVLVLFFSLSAGTAMAASTLGVLFSEQFPTKVRALGTSATNQIARGLSLFPPLIAAEIYPIYGYAPVFLIGAFLALLQAFSFWMIRERRGESLDF
jgi:MFS family permease